jgi:hypothetical protein
MDEKIQNEDELRQKISKVANKFNESHNIALENTKRYLSMVGDLDVYVNTSMRNRGNFRDMVNYCENIFLSPRLRALNIRRT